MISSFEAKLSQVSSKRNKEWGNYHKAQKEIKELSSDAANLDNLLALMGQETSGGNVLQKDADSKKQKRDHEHPIQGTDVIDDAIRAAQKNGEVSEKWFSGLLSIMQNSKKSAMHYDAALALAAICEPAMLRANTYEACKKYKSYLDTAFSVLVRHKDPDTYYAQWGVILYTTCLQKAATNGTEEACVKECKEAYDKFQKVQKPMQGMEDYAGYKPGAEVWEARLLKWSLQDRFGSAENVLKQVLNSAEGVQRAIVKKYRYRVLETVIQQLGQEKKSLGKAEKLITEQANTFAGDVRVILTKHLEKMQDAAVEDYCRKVDKLMESGIEANHHTIFRKEFTQAQTRISGLKREAASGKWDGVVPEATVKKYFDSCKKEYEQKREQLKADGWKNYIKDIEKTAENAYKNPYIQMDYSSAEQFVSKIKKYAVTNKIKKEVEERVVRNWVPYVATDVLQGYYKSAYDQLTKGTSSTDILGTIKWFLLRVVTNPIVILIVIGFVAMGGIGYAVDYFQNKAGTENNAGLNDYDLEIKLMQDLDKKDASNSATAAAESDFSYSIESYNYKFKYACITKYNGLDTTVEIPAVIDGYKVLSIGREAFADNIYLEKVILPDTVCYIDYRAFSNCQVLKEVQFSKNLTSIAEGAFSECVALTAITCESDSSSLKYIGENAFANDTALKTVDIVSDTYQTVEIADGAFKNCTALEQVNLSGERIQSVIMGAHAFNTCTSLKNVSYSDKITQMDGGVFANCTSLQNMSFASLVYIPGQAFLNCTSLTSFTVSDTVKGIDGAAFMNCTSLEEVMFEDVKLGAEEAGFGIGDDAFYNTAMKEIDIPGAYAQIGKRAFSTCPNLTKVVWHGSQKNTAYQSLNEHVFVDSPMLQEVYLPRTVASIDRQDLSKMSKFTIYAMENSVGYTFAQENQISWAEWSE